MDDPAKGEGGGPPRAVSRIGADLPARAAAAVVMAGFALGAAWVGGFTFLAFWLIAAAIVLWEWQRLIDAENLWTRVGVGLVALVVVAPFALRGSIVGSLAALIAGSIAVGWFAAAPLRVWAAAGALYAGALLASLVLLRGSPNFGLAAICWLFAVVWGADICAYFAGRLIGGPKLWPRVSPGKTWSGAIVGACAGAALGLALFSWTDSLSALLELGLATAVVSELGDLFESALKRRFGVKDSSHLIPGHGGLLDRLDAFTAASIFAAAVATFRTRGDWIASGIFQW